MPDPNPAKRKFTDLQREEILCQIARLDRMGWQQYEIAEEVGVTQGQVSLYIKKIRKRYWDTQVEDRAILVAEKIEQYRDVIKACWAAYIQSLQDIRKVENTYFPPYKDKKGKNDPDEMPEPDRTEPMRLSKKVKSRSKRLPAVEYLNTIRQCLDSMCLLKGLYPAKRVEMSANVLNWDVLAQSSPPPSALITVEQEIQAILDAPIPDPTQTVMQPLPNGLKELNEPPHTNGQS